MRLFRKPKPAKPRQVWPVADEVLPQWMVEQWTGVGPAAPVELDDFATRPPMFLDALPKEEADRLPTIESVCARLAKTLRNETSK
jgi:hypothetical protein